MQHGPRPVQDFQQNYAPPGFQGQQQGSQRVENQGQRRSHSFEDQMLAYMSENKRILNLNEQKFAELAVFQANTTVSQANTNASLKNLETQVGQLALAIQNQSKDSFPSDTKKNPKDCMAITLRSGRELQKREEDEIKLTEKEEQAKTGKENKLNITELTNKREKSKVQ